MLIGNPVKPGSIVRGRKEPEELESERVKRAASELGSLGGKARAARMPPERRKRDRPKSSSKKVKQAAESRVIELAPAGSTEPGSGSPARRRQRW
jgi:hypothetical protein